MGEIRGRFRALSDANRDLQWEKIDGKYVAQIGNDIRLTMHHYGGGWWGVDVEIEGVAAGGDRSWSRAAAEAWAAGFDRAAWVAQQLDKARREERSARVQLEMAQDKVALYSHLELDD